MREIHPQLEVEQHHLHVTFHILTVNRPLAMESQRSPILFILVLVAVLQQHGHHVQTAPTTGARQTDPMHEMKAEQFSATNNLDLLGSRINWGLAEAETASATTTNDAMHRKEEEGERRLVSDIETLSTAATVHQSGLDDSSIKANDRNKTANDEEATSAASSSSASSTRTATENATPTSPLSTAGSPSSFTAVSSSSPSSIVPRKKIRRSTTTTTSTTALPAITTEEESEEVNQKSTENLLAKTTTDLDSEFTSSPRPKTRKMRKKVSKKIDWETSTQQQQVTTWTTTTGEEEVEATTVTSATSPEEELESNGMVTTTKFEIQSTTDYSVPPEEQRTIGAVGVESESVDEHDRGNAVRVTPTTTTRSTSPSTTTERQDMEDLSERTTPGVLPGEVSMDYVSRIQTTTMGTNADGESSFVTGASSTSASELPLASGTVKTTEIDLPTEESPGFTLNQDQKPEGDEKNRKEDADEEELKVASTDSRTEANDHHTQLSAAKELFPKSSSSHPSPPAAADDENPPTKFENFESNAEEEAPSVQLSSIVPSTTTPSTPDQQHRQDLTSATEFVESTPIATHQDQIFVTHTPSEVVSTSSSSSSSANDLRLTSTTVFEDNSAITTTTEFISSQSAATPLGHVIHENSDASETQKRNEGDEKEQDKIADNPPTTEPRVEGINVENVEESLSPIPDDDVLVVEIEESNETPQVSQEEEETTTLVVTGGTYSSSPSAPSTEPPTTTLRPKLNDELFYPIGGREGGGVGGDETETELVRERGRVDLEDDNNESTDREEETKDIDGRGNDNDGDFDLEAEIFPTIPAPKNALFDSEILREKGDLKESDTDAEHVTSRGNGIVRGGHVETSTTVPSQSTTTRELYSPPEKTSSYKTIKTTSFEDSPEVSTTVGHHDSDTFFYISNTEVKVVESDSVQSPKAVSHTQELSFPENSHEEGLSRTLPHQNHSHRSVAAVELNERRRQQEQGERSPLLVEEDIILSQAVNENNFNSNRDPGGFDFLKFAAAERPQRVTEVEGETRSGEEVDQEEDSEEVTKRISQGNTEQLSFVKVEETTEVYSSEEAFEFLHRDREEEEQKFILSSSSSRERSREDSIPEVIIEPYPQLMDTDNDLPISIGVPVIAELPQQIQIATANEEGHGHGQDEVKSGQLPSYHHFDIDNREIENANNDNSNNNRKSMKTTAVGKFKKSGPGKKKLANRKKPDRDESFSDIIFENAENFLVKNPSISLEVPVLDFNFSILASTSTTMEPKLNFTNETTLMLEEEPIGKEKWRELRRSLFKIIFNFIIAGINDLQTLFFTCFITLMLLVAAVFVAFVAR